MFALNYGSYNGSGSLGIYGTGPIEDSAGQLADFVDRVLAATGASQVDLVGHSQGGMMPRCYLKFDNGAAKVHTLVGLSPSNHGTTLDGIFTLASHLPGANATFADCPACAEQEAGSPFMTNLNAGGGHRPGLGAVPTVPSPRAIASASIPTTAYVIPRATKPDRTSHRNGRERSAVLVWSRAAPTNCARSNPTSIRLEALMGPSDPTLMMLSQLSG